jgi:hypothetical protein
MDDRVNGVLEAGAVLVLTVAALPLVWAFCYAVAHFEARGDAPPAVYSDTDVGC